MLWRGIQEKHGGGGAAGRWGGGAGAVGGREGGRRRGGGGKGLKQGRHAFLQHHRWPKDSDGSFLLCGVVWWRVVLRSLPPALSLELARSIVLKNSSERKAAAT